MTATQLMTVIEDADLPARASDLLTAMNKLGDLDFESSAAIGTWTRRGLLDAITDAERVRDETRRLAGFKPPADLQDLPSVLGSLTARAAALIAQVIDATSAERASEAMEANKRLQQLLDAPLDLDRLFELLAVAKSMVTLDDLDARASLATGITARYTDELGFLDPTLIFSAAAASPSPMEALARGAGQYLSHLLDTPVDQLSSGASILILCAVPLAVLDRPFGAHRTAELVRELLRRAATRGHAELAAAISTYDERQGRAFSAAARALREARLVRAGQIENPVEVVESLVEIYKRLAEGPYRAGMRLILAARAAAEQRRAPSGSPMLGEIDDMLAGWNDELGRSLDGAVDRDLRNAEAHDDYHVDAKTLDVVIDGRRISPDALEAALRDLTALLAAMEAAILCHRIDADDSFRTPDWIASGEQPDAATIIIRAIAGAWGIDVTDVALHDAELHLTLKDQPDCDPSLARRILVASAPLVPQTDALRIDLVDGGSIAMGTGAIKAWRTAAADEADLAFIELLHDSQVRSGAPSGEALADALAAQVRLIINQDLQQIHEAPQPNGPRRRLARRVRRVTRFAAAHRAGSEPKLIGAAAGLRAARGAADAAARDARLVPTAVARLVDLSPWADSRAIPYPNEVLASAALHDDLS